MRRFESLLPSQRVRSLRVNKRMCTAAFRRYGNGDHMACAEDRLRAAVLLWRKSADEVVRFLEAILSLKSRTTLTTVYAAGLRVSEAVLLKIADIDSQRMVIRVEQGKGGKDRYVMLSPQLLRFYAPISGSLGRSDGYFPAVTMSVRLYPTSCTPPAVKPARRLA